MWYAVWLYVAIYWLLEGLMQVKEDYNCNQNCKEKNFKFFFFIMAY